MHGVMGGVFFLPGWTGRGFGPSFVHILVTGFSF